MLDWQSHKKLRIFIKTLCIIMTVTFLSYDLAWSGATEVLSFKSLPVLPQASFAPPTLKYLSVNEANPHNYFNFLLDKGQLSVTDKSALNKEAKQLINYFFLGITIPDDAFWVNLRPTESDRITSKQLSRTDLGRTLLEQDFRLKRDMSQYLNPQNPIGRQFWEKLYSTLGKDRVKKAGITTSNRVWIVPAEAVVVETEEGAFLAKSSLKVLLESEYAALKIKPSTPPSIGSSSDNSDGLKAVTQQLMKEIIIPAITKDVNESQNYAPLRQIYHSLILAQWFKRRHKNANSSYAQAINKGYLKGLESQLPWEKQQIWQEYLKSYNQGEYKIQDTIFGLKRMYFSGGVLFDLGAASFPLKVITQKELPTVLKQDPDLLNSNSLKDNLVVLIEEDTKQENSQGQSLFSEIKSANSLKNLLQEASSSIIPKKNILFFERLNKTILGVSVFVFVSLALPIQSFAATLKGNILSIEQGDTWGGIVLKFFMKSGERLWGKEGSAMTTWHKLSGHENDAYQAMDHIRVGEQIDVSAINQQVAQAPQQVSPLSPPIQPTPAPKPESGIMENVIHWMQSHPLETALIGLAIVGISLLVWKYWRNKRVMVGEGKVGGEPEPKPDIDQPTIDIKKEDIPPVDIRPPEEVATGADIEESSGESVEDLDKHILEDIMASRGDDTLHRLQEITLLAKDSVNEEEINNLQDYFEAIKERAAKDPVLSRLDELKVRIDEVSLILSGAQRRIKDQRERDAKLNKIKVIIDSSLKPENSGSDLKAAHKRISDEINIAPFADSDKELLINLLEERVGFVLEKRKKEEGQKEREVRIAANEGVKESDLTRLVSIKENLIEKTKLCLYFEQGKVDELVDYIENQFKPKIGAIQKRIDRINQAKVRYKDLSGKIDNIIELEDGKLFIEYKGEFDRLNAEYQDISENVKDDINIVEQAIVQARSRLEDDSLVRDKAEEEKSKRKEKIGQIKTGLNELINEASAILDLNSIGEIKDKQAKIAVLITLEPDVSQEAELISLNSDLAGFLSKKEISIKEDSWSQAGRDILAKNVNIRRLISGLKRYVLIDSPSGQEDEIVRKLSEDIQLIFKAGVVLKSPPSPTAPIPANVILDIPATKGYQNEPALILNAHMDTIDAKPDNIIVKDAEIRSKSKRTPIGLDDAVGLAVIVEALQVLQEKWHKTNIPHRTIRVIFSADEEMSKTPVAYGVTYLKDHRSTVLDIFDNTHLVITVDGHLCKPDEHDLNQALEGRLTPFSAVLKNLNRSDIRFVQLEEAARRLKADAIVRTPLRSGGDEGKFAEIQDRVRNESLHVINLRANYEGAHYQTGEGPERIKIKDLVDLTDWLVEIMLLMDKELKPIPIVPSDKIATKELEAEPSLDNRGERIKEVEDEITESFRNYYSDSNLEEISQSLGVKIVNDELLDGKDKEVLFNLAKEQFKKISESRKSEAVKSEQKILAALEEGIDNSDISKFETLREELIKQVKFSGYFEEKQRTELLDTISKKFDERIKQLKKPGGLKIELPQPYAAIIFDIDKTLTKTISDITPEMLEQLLKLMEQNVSVAFITAQGIDEVEEHIIKFVSQEKKYLLHNLTIYVGIGSRAYRFKNNGTIVSIDEYDKTKGTILDDDRKNEVEAIIPKNYEKLRYRSGSFSVKYDKKVDVKEMKKNLEVEFKKSSWNFVIDPAGDTLHVHLNNTNKGIAALHFGKLVNERFNTSVPQDKFLIMGDSFGPNGLDTDMKRSLPLAKIIDVRDEIPTLGGKKNGDATLEILKNYINQGKALIIGAILALFLILPNIGYAVTGNYMPQGPQAEDEISQESQRETDTSNYQNYQTPQIYEIKKYELIKIPKPVILPKINIDTFQQPSVQTSRIEEKIIIDNRNERIPAYEGSEAERIDYYIRELINGWNSHDFKPSLAHFRGIDIEINAGALNGLITIGKPAVFYLVDALERESSPRYTTDTRNRLAVLTAIAKIAENTNDADSWVAAYRESISLDYMGSERLKDELANEVIENGIPSLRPLINLLSNHSDKIREESGTLLAQMSANPQYNNAISKELAKKIINWKYRDKDSNYNYNEIKDDKQKYEEQEKDEIETTERRPILSLLDENKNIKNAVVERLEQNLFLEWDWHARAKAIRTIYESSSFWEKTRNYALSYVVDSYIYLLGILTLGLGIYFGFLYSRYRKINVIYKQLLSYSNSGGLSGELSFRDRIRLRKTARVAAKKVNFDIDDMFKVLNEGLPSLPSEFKSKRLRLVADFVVSLNKLGYNSENALEFGIGFLTKNTRDNKEFEEGVKIIEAIYPVLHTYETSTKIKTSSLSRFIAETSKDFVTFKIICKFSTDALNANINPETLSNIVKDIIKTSKDSQQISQRLDTLVKVRLLLDSSIVLSPYLFSIAEKSGTFLLQNIQYINKADKSMFEVFSKLDDFNDIDIFEALNEAVDGLKNKKWQNVSPHDFIDPGWLKGKNKDQVIKRLGIVRALIQSSLLPTQLLIETLEKTTSQSSMQATVLRTQRLLAAFTPENYRDNSGNIISSINALGQSNDPEAIEKLVWALTYSWQKEDGKYYYFPSIRDAVKPILIQIGHPAVIPLTKVFTPEQYRNHSEALTTAIQILKEIKDPAAIPSFEWAKQHYWIEDSTQYYRPSVREEAGKVLTDVHDYISLEEAIDSIKDLGVQLAQWQRLLKDFKTGAVKFDVNNPVYVDLEYTTYVEIAGQVNSNSSYGTYIGIVNKFRSSANPSTLSNQEYAEVKIAVYEAFKLLDFIKAIKNKTHEPIWIVPNLTYGKFAISPILGELGKLGIEIHYAKIGSSECHNHPNYIKPGLFTDEEYARIMKERPIIIAVDGTQHLLARPEERKSSRYPDAYIGYRNFIAVMNDVNQAKSEEFLDKIKINHDFLNSLRNDQNYKELVEKLKRDSNGDNTTYALEFWNPGGLQLVVREARKEIQEIMPFVPEKVIDNPMLIFVNGVLIDEDVPKEIKDWAKLEAPHTPAFYDDKDTIKATSFAINGIGIYLSSGLEYEVNKATNEYKNSFYKEPSSPKPRIQQSQSQVRPVIKPIYDAMIFDLDGTLAETLKPVDASVLNNISILLNAGVKIAIVTSQSLSEVRNNILDRIKDSSSLNNLYIYTARGAQAFNFNSNQPVAIYDRTTDLTQEQYDRLREILKNISKDFGKVDVYDRQAQITIHIDDKKKRNDFTQKLQAGIDNNGLPVDVENAGKRTIHLLLHGINKGTAVQNFTNLLYVSKHAYIDPKRILIIGDQFNGSDKSMIIPGAKIISVGERDKTKVPLGVEAYSDQGWRATNMILADVIHKSSSSPITMPEIGINFELISLSPLLAIGFIVSVRLLRAYRLYSKMSQAITFLKPRERFRLFIKTIPDVPWFSLKSNDPYKLLIRILPWLAQKAHDDRLTEISNVIAYFSKTKFDPGDILKYGLTAISAKTNDKKKFVESLKLIEQYTKLLMEKRFDASMFLKDLMSVLEKSTKTIDEFNEAVLLSINLLKSGYEPGPAYRMLPEISGYTKSFSEYRIALYALYKLTVERFEPTEYLIKTLIAGNDSSVDKIIADWKKLGSNIKLGKVDFDVNNPLHVDLEYTIFRELVDRTLKQQHRYSYQEYLSIITNASKQTSVGGLNKTEKAEVKYAAYEALRLMQFISKVYRQAKIQGRDVWIVPNLSYGRFAVSPILEDLRRDGVDVHYARIGSTESHNNPQLIKPDLFSSKLYDRIINEKPIIIVVDGTQHLLARPKDRKSSRYPDAYVGYRNLVITINDIISGAKENSFKSLLKTSGSLISDLRKTPDYRTLKRRLLRFFKPAGKQELYSMEFWNPGGLALVAREARKEKQFVKPFDANNINGPMLIFVNSVILDDDIPRFVKKEFGSEKIVHTPAYFDDTSRIQNIIFNVNPRGIHLSDSLNKILRDEYNKIKSIYEPSLKLDTQPWQSDVPFKIGIFDLDGTLATTLRPISKPVLNKLLYLMQAGMHIALITVQSLDELNHTIINEVPKPQRPLLQNLILYSGTGSQAWGFDIKGNLIPEPFYDVSKTHLSAEQNLLWRKIIKTVLEELGLNKTLIDLKGRTLAESATIIDGQAQIIIRLKERRDLRDIVLKKLSDEFIKGGLPLVLKKIGRTSIRMNVEGIDKKYALEFHLKEITQELGREIDPKEILVVGNSFDENGDDRQMWIKDARVVSVGSKPIDHGLRKGIEFYPIKGWQGTSYLLSEIINVPKTQIIKTTPIEEINNKASYIARKYPGIKIAIIGAAGPTKEYSADIGIELGKSLRIYMDDKKGYIFTGGVSGVGVDVYKGINMAMRSMNQDEDRFFTLLPEDVSPDQGYKKISQNMRAESIGRNMYDRRIGIAKLADIVIVLNGRSGTMHEAIAALESGKRVIVLNYGGAGSLLYNAKRDNNVGKLASEGLKPEHLSNIILSDIEHIMSSLKGDNLSSPAASSSPINNHGGIDLSNIELTLKDEKFVSNLNSADLKILRAARALEEGQNSLAVLYVHEVRLLFKDNILLEKDITQKVLLHNLLSQLERKELLSPEAVVLCHTFQGEAVFFEERLSSIGRIK